MTFDELEDLIEEKIAQLKPEIRKRFVYRLTDEKSNFYATTQHFQPPMITFFLSNIQTMTDKPMEVSVKELLTHEIIHVIQTPGQECKEHEAVERFQTLNFFQ